MPAKPKNPPVPCRFYTWKLRQREGVWFADGRSQTPSLGRHSLNTRDREEAMRRMAELDLRLAVQHGRASPAALAPAATNPLDLEAGRKLYSQHVERPPSLGGAKPVTAKRYRAVFDKFIPFLQERGITDWNAVCKRELAAYVELLDEQDRSPYTIYMEATVVKQANKWFIGEGLLPESTRITLAVHRPEGSDRYCWSDAEVEAMLDRCFDPARPGLRWLGYALLGLASTGLRIGELVQLRWTDLDMDAGMLKLPDRQRSARRSQRANARSTKGKRERVLPLTLPLLRALRGMPHAGGGLVFRAAGGGPLDPDKVRTCLIRDVQGPLKARFPKADADAPGFEDGVPHSFRHYFVSTAANGGVPERSLQQWLGHKDAEMVSRYYHLRAEQSKQHMEKLDGRIAGGAGAAWQRLLPQVNSDGSTLGQIAIPGKT